MSVFDLITRNGTIATASDSYVANLGLRGGRAVTIGEAPGGAEDEIDATGKLVPPGRIDSHVHISQPSGPSIVMADDFESATQTTAFGGDSFVVPYYLQEKGQSLHAALTAYHA